MAALPEPLGKKVAMTAAERMRKYRAKMSSEKIVETKRKNAEDQKARRQSWTASKKRSEAAKSRERMRAMRKRKKELNPNQDLSLNESPSKSFITPQSYGKAVQRVKRALPVSPRKQRAIVKKLAIQYGIETKKQPKTREDSDNETKRLVVACYESDIISRQCPGMKDYVTVRKDGAKETIQKKIMNMTVMEAHRLFKQEHPGVKVGKSLFAKLRPAHVKLSSHKDHNVCCCKYHENFQLLLDGFKNAGFNLPTLDEIVRNSVCMWVPSCCLNKCTKCDKVSAFVDQLMGNVSSDDEIIYYQWDSENKKEAIKSTAKYAVEVLTEQLTMMRHHCFIAKTQLRAMKFLKNNLSSEEAVMQVDYSENFAIRQQNEIMAAHWVSEGVTLYTCVITQNGSSTNYVVVSDDLQHDKFSVFCCNQLILEEHLKNNAHISTLHICSDGAPSQFKNRYIVSLVCEPKTVHPSLSSITMTFFGTAHGKGPVDGVGGTIKRAVWRIILQGKNVINSAEEFFEVAKNVSDKVKVLFLSKTKIQACREEKGPEWTSENIPAIPGLKGLHYFQLGSTSDFQCCEIYPREFMWPMKNVFACPSYTVDKNKETVTDICVGDYVAVLYENVEFYGTVNEIAANGDMLVNAKQPTRRGWVWPTRKDEIWYESDNVLKKVDPPVPVNSRGVMVFN